MLGFAVERQSETIRQKLLKHVLSLKQALIFTKLLQRIKHRFVHLRVNIVSFPQRLGQKFERERPQPALAGPAGRGRIALTAILLVAGSLVLQSALHLELMNRGVNVKNVLTGERSQESRSRKRSAAACRSRRGYSGANRHGVLLT